MRIKAFVNMSLSSNRYILVLGKTPPYMGFQFGVYSTSYSEVDCGDGYTTINLLKTTLTPTYPTFLKQGNVLA